MLAGLCALSATGCRSSGRSASAVSSPPALGQATNQPPTITGQPGTSAEVNYPYDFLPYATDPDSDDLEFEIAGLPGWARFDPYTGRLSGTPSSSSTGAFENIVITVTDGHNRVSLAPFTIVVGGGAVMGTANLKWSPPTQTVDGQPLSDLAGYRVYYGQTTTDLTRVVTVADQFTTEVVVHDLDPGTWYFSVTAYTSQGVESTRSNVVSKRI
jgi:hypothetical protein